MNTTIPKVVETWMASSENADMLGWDMIVALPIELVNDSVLQALLRKFAGGEAPDGLEGKVEIPNSSLLHHLDGYRLTSPKLYAGASNYVDNRIKMSVSMEGGGHLLTRNSVDVMSLSAHTPLNALKPSFEVPITLAGGTLNTDLRAGSGHELTLGGGRHRGHGRWQGAGRYAQQFGRDIRAVGPCLAAAFRAKPAAPGRSPGGARAEQYRCSRRRRAGATEPVAVRAARTWRQGRGTGGRQRLPLPGRAGGRQTALHGTGFAYDPFNRNVKTVLPDGAFVLRTYAEHSGEDLPITIAVQQSALAEVKELGTQGFDGLGRMALSNTGGREQAYIYDAGVRKPKTVSTPEGEIHYTYELKLSENPASRVMGATAGELAVIYNYDKKNARLDGWTMPAEGERHWQKLKCEYHQTGQIKSETWTQHESGDEDAPPIGEPQTQHYVYSHRGRLLKYTDVLGQIQTNDYYPTGQLKKTTLKDKAGKVLLETDFTYYELGQLQSYTTHDREAGQSLATELKYDEFDREIERKFTAGSMVQTLTQLYDDVDALKTRTLSEKGVNLRVETYGHS